MAELPSSNPAIDCYPVTPNDSVDLAPIPRGLMIGTGGAVKITTLAGNAVTVTLPAGFFPCAVKRVWATGLTAASITALV